MNRGRSESMGVDYDALHVVESIRRKAAQQTAHSQSPPSRHQLQLHQLPQLSSPRTNSPCARVGRIRSNSSPTQSPLDSPAARKAIDELRGAPKFVELHRSSSGRNLRLVSRRSDEVASHALTPKRPTQRTGSGRVGKVGSEPVFRFEDFAPRSPAISREPSVSSEEKTECEQQSSPQYQPSTRKQDRRSSFSISKLALQILESGNTRSDSFPPEHDLDTIDDGDTNQVDDDDSEDEAEDEEEEATEYEEPTKELTTNAQDEGSEEKAVYCFDLWKKAGRNRSLPGAISTSAAENNNEQEDDGGEENQQQHHVVYFEEEKRSCEQIDFYSKPSEPEAKAIFSKWAFEDNDPPSSPHSAPMPISIVKELEPLSLTRSMSPRIGSSSTRSSRRTISTETHTTTITKWKRGELIGEGTFGKVYRGLNSITGELFALKEIELRASANSSAVQMKQAQKLGEEIAVMNNLSHPHIVRYQGSYRTATHFYIFMEYVPGGSIASMLKQFDAFKEDLIRHYTRQIVEGVAYLHRMGVIHRDIKGANVLVNEQGAAKLADFGCSKQLSDTLTTSLEESLRSIRGSVPWMAPEVVKQTGHGFKADIWSIGATVIEMATARHPWPSSTTSLSAMFAIATATGPPPFPSTLSPQALSFLERCLCIKPKARASAEELLMHPFLLVADLKRSTS